MKLGNKKFKKVLHKGTLYYVTRDGELFSRSKRTGIIRRRDVRPNPATGYLQLDSGYAHRIIATAYCRNPKKKPCVNHRDGNKQNNHPSNLEWVTYSENHLHSYKHLGRKTPVGTDKGGGVSFRKDRNTFRAIVGSRQWRTYLGTFKTRKEAESAVKKFRKSRLTKSAVLA